MRASQFSLALTLSLVASFTLAGNDSGEKTNAEAMPPLELLNFLADFSDESGWIDPQELERLFQQGEETEQEQKELKEQRAEDLEKVGNTTPDKSSRNKTEISVPG